MSCYNFLLSISNFPIIFPLITTYSNNDNITFISIFFVGLMSFLSHLVENHKHDMKGIGFSKKISYILNRLDVLGCLIVSIRFLQLYYYNYARFLNSQFYIMLSISLSFNLISAKSKTKFIYIISHILWHISIFLIMDYAYRGLVGLVPFVQKPFLVVPFFV